MLGNPARRQPRGAQRGHGEVSGKGALVGGLAGGGGCPLQGASVVGRVLRSLAPCPWSRLRGQHLLFGGALLDFRCHSQHLLGICPLLPCLPSLGPMVTCLLEIRKLGQGVPG